MPSSRPSTKTSGKLRKRVNFPVSVLKFTSAAAPLKQSDPAFHAILRQEEERQQTKLSLIPSENFFSPAVRAAVGSVFSHKYSEGNIGARYYEGNQYVDEMEALAIRRAKQAFRLPADWDVNVQALSGSAANLAVYLAVLEFGDTILSMYLPDGGHLSHGWKAHVTGKMFKVVQFKTDPATQLFNYDEIERLARQHKPKLIITGGTAYPRNIDYQRMRTIADRVQALYVADIAHEAGLVSAGVVPSPVGIADVVTMTTHKTLRAGRGAIILARADLIKKINRAVLPGLQGGPHNHNIAGMTVGLGEALKPAFKRYANQVVKNAQALAKALQTEGFTIVSGGTDKHLVLLDLTREPLLGKKFATVLDTAGLVTNANTIPHDVRGPLDPSGLRLGTPWVTTRGLKEREMKQIAGWMRRSMNDPSQATAIAKEVRRLCQRFPLPIAPKT